MPASLVGRERVKYIVLELSIVKLLGYQLCFDGEQGLALHTHQYLLYQTGAGAFDGSLTRRCAATLARGMQVVGAMGFIIASAMLLNETQHRWWQPKPLDIGWHVAFWNMVVRAPAIWHFANSGHLA